LQFYIVAIFLKSLYHVQFVRQVYIMMMCQCNITTGFPETCFSFDTALLACIVKTVNVYHVVCWNAKSGRNAIPLNIRVSPSVTLFKRNLKTLLFCCCFLTLPRTTGHCQRPASPTLPTDRHCARYKFICSIVLYCCITQTSVQWTMEDVAFMPPAASRRARSRVHVGKDLREMARIVLVSWLGRQYQHAGFQ